MRSRALLKALAAVTAIGVTAPPSAAADGLPVPVDYTFGEGVVSADGADRFVSLSSGDRTLVMRISVDGGEVTDHTTIDGNYTVPAIAVDGTASGISADGETLALINPRRSFPRKTTELLVFEATRLGRNPDQVSLAGDFSFDALSPDGETMYLIEYTDPRDPGAYQVRSYDLSAEELDPQPILDPEEAPDEMRGFPQTRATSNDGQWEYTLYDGGGNHPFIHALNVEEGTTVCIDLPIHPEDTYGAELTASEDGAAVELVNRKGNLLAVVDTATHEAREPGAETEAASAEPTQPAVEIAGLAFGGLIIAGLAAIAVRRRRRE